jgi:hypothetical protein
MNIAKLSKVLKTVLPKFVSPLLATLVKEPPGRITSELTRRREFNQASPDESS